MLSLESFSELLGVLYSAPLDDEQWERFLTLLTEHTGSTVAAFIYADSRLGLSARNTGNAGPLKHDIEIYNQKYAADDPFRGALIRNARTGVFPGSEVLPDRHFLVSRLYLELLRHMGLRYVTLVPLTLSVRRLESISVWRGPHLGPMHEDGNHLLNLLFPHIQQALEIRQVLGVTQQRLAGAQAMADASSTATFLLTRHGRVVHANSAADALVSEGGVLMIQNGTLAAMDGRMREALRETFLKAGSPTFSSRASTATHALALPRADRGQPLQVLAAPVPQMHHRHSGAELLLLVTDPDQTTNYPDSVLRALYGLTAAETEVANGLLMGYSVGEIASLRQVSTGTTRNQLKSILSKTSSARQADLVRLLMAIPRTPASSSLNLTKN